MGFERALLKKDLPFHKYPPLINLKTLGASNEILKKCSRGYKHINWTFNNHVVAFPDPTPSWMQRELKQKKTYKEAISERLTQAYTRLVQTHGLQIEHIQAFNYDFLPIQLKIL